jgi:hypothetical protein
VARDRREILIHAQQLHTGRDARLDDDAVNSSSDSDTATSKSPVEASGSNMAPHVEREERRRRHEIARANEIAVSRKTLERLGQNHGKQADI